MRHWSLFYNTVLCLQQYAGRYAQTCACRVAQEVQVDKPLSIDKFGRLALDLPAPKKAEATGHTIAVIGGGPAGLSAAWQLGLKGTYG